MPKRSATRELRRKLRDFADTLRYVQLIALDNNGKRIEITDIDIKEMKANIKDLDAPGTSRFWVDDPNYLGSLVPITKRPEHKPKITHKQSEPLQLQEPPKPQLKILDPEPPKAGNGIWCYYCKAHRGTDTKGRCIVCCSRLAWTTI